MADETIGTALRRAREEAGLTLRDVSQASGESVNQISQVETGRRADPAFTTVARIAAGLDLSLDGISRAVGLVDEGPTLKSRLPVAHRKRLLAIREIEDVADSANAISQRIHAALKSMTDEADVSARPMRRKKGSLVPHRGWTSARLADPRDRADEDKVGRSPRRCRREDDRCFGDPSPAHAGRACRL